MCESTCCPHTIQPPREPRFYPAGPEPGVPTAGPSIQYVRAMTLEERVAALEEEVRKLKEPQTMIRLVTSEITSGHNHNLFEVCTDFENCWQCHDHAQDERHTQHCGDIRRAIASAACVVNVGDGTCQIHGKLADHAIFAHSPRKYRMV